MRTTKYGGASWRVTNGEQGLLDALTRFVRAAQQLVFPVAGLLLVSLRSMGACDCRYISSADEFSGHALGGAVDISGRTVREQVGAGAERGVIYERLFRARQGPPLDRIGACVHLDFGQALDWTFNADRVDHFHAEITDSRAARWRCVDRLLTSPSATSLAVWLGRAAPRSCDVHSAACRRRRDPRQGPARIRRANAGAHLHSVPEAIGRPGRSRG